MRFTTLLLGYLLGTVTMVAAVWASGYFLARQSALQEMVRKWSQPSLIEEMASRELIRETWEPLGSYVAASELREAAKPIGKLEISYEGSDRVGVCTGSIIDEFTILTAYHCLQPPVSNPSLKVERIQIIFDFLSSDDPLGRFTPDSKLRVFNLDPNFFVDGAKPNGTSVDFVLLKATGNFLSTADQREVDPSAVWGKIQISPEVLEPNYEVTPLIIIHHPRNRLPMQVSRYSCHANGHRNVPGKPDESYGHSCATEPGSSGAPVFAQEDLRVIGIHRGSIPGASTARPISGILPQFNVFSGVHDMLKQSLSEKAKTSSGKFAEIVLAQNPSLSERYARLLAPKIAYRTAATYSDAVERSVQTLSFDVPNSFATERLGRIHTVDEQNAIGASCTTLYLGGDFIVTPYHCTDIDQHNSYEYGLFDFSGLSDLRLTNGSEKEIPVFELKLRDSFLISRELDYAIYEISGLQEFVDDFTSKHDAELSPLIVGQQEPAVATKVDLLYLNQSNTLTRIGCEVTTEDSFDSSRLAYGCMEELTSTAGSSGGVVIDDQGRVLAIHMYGTSDGIRGGTKLGLISDQLERLDVGIVLQ